MTIENIVFLNSNIKSTESLIFINNNGGPTNMENITFENNSVDGDTSFVKYSRLATLEANGFTFKN